MRYQTESSWTSPLRASKFRLYCVPLFLLFFLFVQLYYFCALNLVNANLRLVSFADVTSKEIFIDYSCGETLGTQNEYWIVRDLKSRRETEGWQYCYIGHSQSIMTSKEDFRTEQCDKSKTLTPQTRTPIYYFIVYTITIECSLLWAIYFRMLQIWQV